MKRKSRKLLSILVAITLFISLNIPVQAKSSKLIYTSLGDSLTDFATYENKNWTTYPYYLAMGLNDAGMNVTLHNHGKGGYQTSQVLELIKSDSEVIKDIKESNLITVQVGANNITYGILYNLVEENIITLPWDFHFAEGTDVKNALMIAAGVLSDQNNKYHKEYVLSAKQDIEDIIATIRGYNSDAEIYIATVYYDDVTFTNLFKDMFDVDYSTAKLLSSGYSVAATEIQGYFKDTAANNENVYLVDNSKESNIEYFQYDASGHFLDIHPNEAGQKVLAECFKEAISNVWKEKIISNTKKIFNVKVM